NLSFAIGDFEEIPEAGFDVVTSFFSLHLVTDKQKAVTKVYNHLKPGGLFICVTPPFHSNPEYDKALVNTMQSTKWKDYFKNFSLTFQFVPLEEYIKIFVDAGFELIKSEYQHSVDPFVSVQEFARWFKGTMPHIHYLPETEQDEF